MRKVLITTASLAALAVMPTLSFADVVVEPEVDTWVMEQPGTSVTVDQDVVVGGVLSHRGNARPWKAPPAIATMFVRPLTGAGVALP